MKRLYVRILWALPVIAALAFVLYPLFRPGFIVTDDGDWMVIRLSAFYQSWRDGQFPVRFLERLNYGYGYPVANFLYPGFMYVGSILHAVGLPFTMAVKMVLGLSVAASAAVLFAWLKHWFSERAAMIGTLSFLFSPYLMFDLYKRGSVGELLALTLALVCFYAIDARKRKLLPFAVAFLIISHNTLAFMVVAAMSAYVVFRRQWWVFVGMALGLGMASFFWIPALGEKGLVHFSGIDVSNPYDYIKESTGLIVSSIVFMFAAIGVVFQDPGSRPKTWKFHVILMAISGAFASGLTIALWKSPLLVKFVQFPFRFLNVWLVSGPFLMAAFASSKRHLFRFGAALALLAVLLVSVIGHLSNVKSVIREEGYYSTNEATTTVADEYMPRWVHDKPSTHAGNKIEYFSGKGTVAVTDSSTRRYAFTVKAEEDSVVRINTIYYPGWGATVDDKPAIVSYGNSMGVMELALPKGEHKAIVEFRETFARFAADLLSVASFGVYLLYLLVLSKPGRPVRKFLEPLWSGMML